MRRFSAVGMIAVAVAGCRPHPAVTTHPFADNTLSSLSKRMVQPSRRLRMGPPPPGYIRIRGESVPNWQPEHLRLQQSAVSISPVWQPLGPRPIVREFWSGHDDASGRVVSIATHPTDPNIVYIASASGGVWKTTDGGLLWVPLTDELSNLNHGCVAIDPSQPNTIYTGTGEYTLETDGDGLFRSRDGGATWERVATSQQVGLRCSGLIVDPTDPQTLHMTGSSGYVRSIDGGLTWENTLPGTASGLALNLTDPSVVYVGRHFDGVYRSSDGGARWEKLAGGLPVTNISRIVLAIAPSNPNTVYAVIIDGSQESLLGLYKTTDGGNTWTRMNNTPDFPFPQGWYNLFLGVDPADEQIVYAGGVFPGFAVAGVIKSTDGGVSWSDITISLFSGQLHPDQHAIAFGPTGTIWIGNDGGVWRSDDGGDTWINTNATLNVTQNYNIALHPTDMDQVMGGTQDNGSIERNAPVDEWPQIVPGDGGFLVYDTSQPLRRYTTFVGLTIFRLFGSVLDAEITGPWAAAGDPVNFLGPLVMDPNDPHTLLVGTNRIWRTRDAHAAAHWQPISDTSVSGFGTINAIAVRPGNSNEIYSGSSTGRVFVTTDGANWADRSAGLPAGQISDLVLHPVLAGTAYVSFHNRMGPRVLRTGDHGMSWVNVTGDLPSGVSARALAVNWQRDPHVLYVGSGAGIYTSFDGGGTWFKDGADLPNVIIGDLAIDVAGNTVTAGTFGRGTWRASLDPDCNGNGLSDFDDIVSGRSADCQPNGIPDQCDIAAGVAMDADLNGIPDQCECSAPSAPLAGLIAGASGAPVPAAKNRVLSITGGDPGVLEALRVTFVRLPAPFSVFEGGHMWAGPPLEYSEAGDRGYDEPCTPSNPCTGNTFIGSALQCEPFYTDWTLVGGPVHIRDNDAPLQGRFIVPQGQYDLQFITQGCSPAVETSFSTALTVTNSRWADVGALSASGDFIAPDGSVSVSDTVSTLDKFRGLPSAPTKPHFDLLGVFVTGVSGRLDGKITINEITAELDEFRGVTTGFPFAPGPAPCNAAISTR